MIWGRPLKGVSTKKNTSLPKKHAVFSLHLTGCRLALKLPIILFRARYFRLWFAWSLTRISHPSGSRQLRFITQNTSPFRAGGPENRRYHAGSNCLFADPVVLYQPLCGCRHRRIKIKSRVWVLHVPIRPGGLLPTPNMVQCRTQTD